jgi:hypothetical protein
MARSIKHAQIPSHKGCPTLKSTYETLLVLLVRTTLVILFHGSRSSAGISAPSIKNCAFPPFIACENASPAWPCPTIDCRGLFKGYDFFFGRLLVLGGVDPRRTILVRLLRRVRPRLVLLTESPWNGNCEFFLTSNQHLVTMVLKKLDFASCRENCGRYSTNHLPLPSGLHQDMHEPDHLERLLVHSLICCVLIIFSTNPSSVHRLALSRGELSLTTSSGGLPFFNCQRFCSITRY